MSLQNNKYSDVQGIVDNNLCTTCGVCASVCPTGAIKFEWNNDSRKPKIDYDKCIHCGACYRVCPGKEIKSQFVKADILESNFSKIDSCFLINRSEKNRNRYIASAGFVTSFLKYLFEKNKINGALVVYLAGNNLKQAKSKLVRKSEELDAVAGSVYCQVPLVDALKELSTVDGKFVVVGLPCQIRGITKLIEVSNDIKNKIILKIGLFCGYMVGYNGMKFLLDSLKIPPHSEIKKISFRAEKNGTDGLLLETDTKEYFIPRTKYTAILNRSFSNKRCLMCNDMSSEFADISCGDAHGFERKQSLVFGRNKRSSELIEDAINSGYLNLNKRLTLTEAYKSQELILKYKKGSIGARLFLMKRFNKVIPNYVPNSLPPNNFSQKIGSFFYILTCYINNNKKLRKIFFLLPNSMIIASSHLLTYFLAGKPLSIFSQFYKKFKKGDKN